MSKNTATQNALAMGMETYHGNTEHKNMYKLFNQMAGLCPFIRSISWFLSDETATPPHPFDQDIYRSNGNHKNKKPRATRSIMSTAATTAPTTEASSTRVMTDWPLPISASTAARTALANAATTTTNNNNKNKDTNTVSNTVTNTVTNKLGNKLSNKVANKVTNKNTNSKNTSTAKKSKTVQVQWQCKMKGSNTANS